MEPFNQMVNLLTILQMYILKEIDVVLVLVVVDPIIIITLFIIINNILINLF